MFLERVFIIRMYKYLKPQRTKRSINQKNATILSTCRMNQHNYCKYWNYDVFPERKDHIIASEFVYCIIIIQSNKALLSLKLLCRNISQGARGRNSTIRTSFSFRCRTYMSNKVLTKILQGTLRIFFFELEQKRFVMSEYYNYG